MPNRGVYMPDGVECRHDVLYLHFLVSCYGKSKATSMMLTMTVALLYSLTPHTPPHHTPDDWLRDAHHQPAHRVVRLSGASGGGQ